MDLGVNYLGLKLRSPLVPSASPLSEELDNVKRMEDAGAGAIVLHSLFEEQLRQDALELHHHLNSTSSTSAEALSYFPEPSEFRLGPDRYLDHIREVKAAVKIPVIASLNGCSHGGWEVYARNMEQAGADALELNIYNIPTSLELSGEQVEQGYLDILKGVRAAVKIPVSVKLSPFFSSPANMAKRLVDAGANGLVLFNRFYQPDLDIEELEVKTHVVLSSSHSTRLPMRWIGVLFGRVNCDLAATTGVHTAEDVIKMVMAGAKITQMCASLLKFGIGHLRQVEGEIKHWMEKHEYESIAQMQGSLSQVKCPNPGAFERAQYMRALNTYKMTGLAS